MNLWHTVKQSKFFIKLTNWEYWPFGIVQFPAFFYFFLLALRSRSFLFFTGSNPGIAMGGLFGESKYDIIKKIPTQHTPKTILISLPTTVEQLLLRLKNEGFSFPIIFKPELGERGFMVKKINNEEDVESYLNKIHINFLVQEFVDLPLEFGIFYTRLPFQQHGKITSIVKKEMLSVMGDGERTLKQLILAKNRAKLQWEKLRVVYADRLHEILPAGKCMEIVSIGNHALGTKFLNGNNLINEEMSRSFDDISKQIEGFYFGRFDIRCASLEDLNKGKVKIMELNGCGAEPAHIYDPDFKLLDAVRTILKHWSTIYTIARANHKNGFQYLSLKEGIVYYKKFRKAVR